jgi:hypothetical protein
MAAFLLTPLGRFIAEIVAVIAIVGSLYAYMRVHYYNNGWNAAIHAIAAQDQRAIDERNKALETVRACRARGGTWNVVDGVCG